MTPPRDRRAPIVSRKAEHIAINLARDVQAHGVDSGFSAYRLVHRALPEIDLDAVRLDAALVGRVLRAPLLVSCMTGGVPEAEPINAALAEAAEVTGIALGLGSGRVLVEHPEATAGFLVRHLAPSVPLLANLGAVQLRRGVGPEECRRLVGILEADALVLHLNALQEALQPRGDTCFGGLLGRIEALVAGLGVPVVVKEVGWGIAPDLVRSLTEAGVAAVDVAGAGGTSWSEVERHRLDGVRARVAAGFAGWGIPAAEAVLEARRAAPQAVIIASGGIRSGMDVLIALALGADLAGAAGPFLRAAATGGPGAVVELVEEWTEVLRVGMFCAGAGDVAALQGSPWLTRDGLPVDRPAPLRAGSMRVVDGHADAVGVPRMGRSGGRG